jgi:hypothetical protein
MHLRVLQGVGRGIILGSFARKFPRNVFGNLVRID